MTSVCIMFIRLKGTGIYQKWLKGSRNKKVVAKILCKDFMMVDGRTIPCKIKLSVGKNRVHGKHSPPWVLCL